MLETSVMILATWKGDPFFGTAALRGGSDLDKSLVTGHQELTDDTCSAKLITSIRISPIWSLPFSFSPLMDSPLIEKNTRSDSECWMSKGVTVPANLEGRR